MDEDSVAELFYTSAVVIGRKAWMLTHRNVYSMRYRSSRPGRPRQHAGRNVVPASDAAHDSTVSRERMGHSTHHYDRRWHSCHASPLQSSRGVPVDRAGEASAPVPWSPRWLRPCCILEQRLKYDLSSLQLITIGGAAAPALVQEVEKILNCSCISGYGLTETSPTLAKSAPKSDSPLDGAQRYARQAMTGFAIPGVELRVLDPFEKTCRMMPAPWARSALRGDGVMDGTASARGHGSSHD